MYITKTAEIQHNQEQQTPDVKPNSSSPKELQGREVKLSPATKIAIGSATLGLLALTGYATYSYFNSKPVVPSSNKADYIRNQLGPKKDEKDFCTDPKTIFNEIYDSGEFKAINISDMKKRFGIDERSMTAKETRAFYNVIAKANREFGNRAIKDYGIKSPVLNEMAKACCETRHNAKVYVRTLGGHIAEVGAKSLDLFRHGITTGQDCKALFKHYKHNATLIMDKAASPNNEVNGFAENLDYGVIFAVTTEFKNRIALPILEKLVGHLSARL